MTRLTPFVLLLSLSVLTSLTLAKSKSKRKINGMALTTGLLPAKYYTPEAATELKVLKRHGTNYIHIAAYARMPGLQATTARWDTDQNALRFIFRKLRKEKLKIFFKPVVEVDGFWRGFITGSPTWFSKVYIPYIIQMARLAQQEKVHLFSLGSEYRTAVDKTSQWINVVNKVRSVYKGKVTYVANHDSYTLCKFWNKLDFISISAYFKLVPGENFYGPSPNLQQTKELWNRKAKEVEDWRKREKLTKKKVIIAEVGAQSKGGGVVYRAPWEWNLKGGVDFNEQSKMYEGFFNAFMPKSWCQGIILWHWELDPNAGKIGASRAGYTPQNKPALKIMIKYFKKF